MFFSQRPLGANLWANKLDLYWMQRGRSYSIRDHGVSSDVLEHIQQGVPNLWAWMGISCQISTNIRLEIKCTVNVTFLNHPETTPPSPGPWKNCLHEINSWCQKHWELLTYRMWTLAGWFRGASMQDWASLIAQLVKNSSAMWETWVQSIDWEDPLEKGKATHSNIIPWTV